uniref:Uncharacterized protein n=1 Tax=Aegilops tauschii subsp. strangulata TaxID=200361 RepID=A0A453DM55_AEGTS
TLQYLSQSFWARDSEVSQSHAPGPGPPGMGPGSATDDKLAFRLARKEGGTTHTYYSLCYLISSAGSTDDFV